MSGVVSRAGRAVPDFVRMSSVRTIKRPVEPIKKWHIVKGDTVAVLSGSDKGKTGKVVAVLRKQNRVVVEGVNLVNKSMRATETQKGGIIKIEQPIHYSNVNLVDPATGKPTRIAIKYTAEGEKVRLAKRSGTLIPKPEDMKKRRAPRPPQPGPSDTPATVASAQTFFPTPELAPYLSKGSSLFAVRKTAEEKVPDAIRDANLRRKDRNRLRRRWADALEAKRIQRLVAAAAKASAAAPQQELQ